MASSAQTDRATKQAEIIALQARVDTAKTTASSLLRLQSERDRLAEVLKSCENDQGQFTQNREDPASLRSQIAQLKSAAAAACAELTDLRAQLAAATQPHASLAPAAPAAPRAEFQVLLTQLTSAQKTIDEKRGDLSQAIDNLAGARKTITTITAAVETVKDLHREAKTPAARALATMSAHVSVAELETDEHIAKLQKAKTTADIQLTAFLLSFTLQQTEIVRLQTELASMNDDCIPIGSKLRAATDELNTQCPQAVKASPATTSYHFALKVIQTNRL